MIALQNKWKTIGFAPQKMNVKIFERFRHACDDFFKKKGEFFKSLKEGMNENLEKKKALCEKAEALKDSTDWKVTADALTKLQKNGRPSDRLPRNTRMLSGNGLSQLATTSLSKEQGHFFTTLCRNREYGKEESIDRKVIRYR